MTRQPRGAHGVRALLDNRPLRKSRAQGRPGARRPHGPPAEKNAGGRYHRFGRDIRWIQSVVATLLGLEVAMTIRKKRSTRARLGSLGRPSVAGRAEQELFWRAIAPLWDETAALVKVI